MTQELKVQWTYDYTMLDETKYQISKQSFERRHDIKEPTSQLKFASSIVPEADTAHNAAYRDYDEQVRVKRYKRAQSTEAVDRCDCLACDENVTIPL